MTMKTGLVQHLIPSKLDPTYRREPRVPQSPQAQPHPEATPLEVAKRFAYSAGLPMASVPFLADLLTRLAAVEAELSELKQHTRHTTLTTAGAEFR